MATIRWPKMQCVDERFLEGTNVREWLRIRNCTMVQREWDRAVIWFAPRWIGWLYRWLPNHFHVSLTGWKTQPALFLANMDAPAWRVGIVMRGRRLPIPAVVVNLGNHLWYLPWGARMYLRLCK